MSLYSAGMDATLSARCRSIAMDCLHLVQTDEALYEDEKVERYEEIDEMVNYQKIIYIYIYI